MKPWLPRHLSVSSVELYARCPAQWKRRYIDRIDTPSTAMVWGSAFHKALEIGHGGGDVEVAWLSSWNAARDNLAARGLPIAPSKTHGLDLLAAFIARGLMIPCPAEVKFVLPFPSGRIPVPLLGYVDAFPSDETREYKTTGGGWWSEQKAQMAHQTHVYGWVRQRTLHDRRPMRYVIFNTRIPTLTEYVVEPSPDGFRLFEKTAEAAWDGISRGVYDGCGMCKELCRPLAESVDNAASFDLEGIA